MYEEGQISKEEALKFLECLVNSNNETIEDCYNFLNVKTNKKQEEEHKY